MLEIHKEILVPLRKHLLLLQEPQVPLQDPQVTHKGPLIPLKDHPVHPKAHPISRTFILKVHQRHQEHLAIPKDPQALLALLVKPNVRHYLKVINH
jgi:hypothetical protein